MVDWLLGCLVVFVVSVVVVTTDELASPPAAVEAQQIPRRNLRIVHDVSQKTQTVAPSA